jgi:hypothetical protein
MNFGTVNTEPNLPNWMLNTSESLLNCEFRFCTRVPSAGQRCKRMPRNLAQQQVGQSHLQGCQLILERGMCRNRLLELGRDR